MILERLYLKNFKRFLSEEILFADGITGIVGNNGTGKSSIVEAILLALFGIRATGIDTSYIISSAARDGEKCTVELTFTLKGQSYTVSRTIGAGNDHAAKIYLNSKILAKGVNEVAGEVKRIIGLSPEDFKNTIYAGQKDLMSLLSKNPGKRKEWFSRVIGIDHLKIESNVILKSEIDETSEKIARTEGKLQELDKVAIESSVSELKQKCIDCEIEFESTGISIDNLDIKKKEFDLNLQVLQEKAQKGGNLSAELSHITDESKRVNDEIVKNEELISSIESNRVLWERITKLEEEYQEINKDLELISEDHIAYTNINIELGFERTRLLELDKKIANERTEISLLGEQVREMETLHPDLKRRETALQELNELKEREKVYSTYINRRNELLQKVSFLEQREKELFSELNAIRAAEEECNSLNIVLAALPTKKEQLKGLTTLQSLHFNLRSWQEQAVKGENELNSLLESEIAIRDKLKGLESFEIEKEKISNEIGLCTQLKGKLQSDLDKLERDLAQIRKDSQDIDEIGEKGTCPLCKQELGEHFHKIHEEYSARKDLLGELFIKKREESKSLKEKMDVLTRTLNEITNSEKQLQVINNEYLTISARIKETNNRINGWKEKVALEEEAIGKISYPDLDVTDIPIIESEVKSLEESKTKRDELVGKTSRGPGLLLEQKKVLDDLVFTKTEIKTVKDEITTLSFNPDEIIKLEAGIRKLEDSYQKYMKLEVRSKEIPAHEKTLSIALKDYIETELKVQSILNRLEKLKVQEDLFTRKKQELNELLPVHKRYQELLPLFHKLPLYFETRENLLERSLYLKSQVEAKESLLKSLNFNPDSIPLIKKDIERLHETINNEKGKAAGLEERISQIKKEIEEKGSTLARIEGYTQEHRELIEQVRVLRITRTAITNYVEYLMNVVQKNIESDVGSLLGIITDGKYEDVILDPDFTVLVHDLNGDFPVERFSGGEQDDIAVALRIALSRYIAGMKGFDESTFLIFDEIFGSQDEERRSNLITAMRSLEQKFPQILLISHIPEVQNEFETTLLVEMTGEGSSKVRQVSY